MQTPARKFLPRACAAAVCFAFSGQILANPVGPTVTAGQATIQSQGNTLTVTNTPGTIIQWQGFSIRADEITRFVQQSALSSILNRVTGGSPSEILGRLSSNGRVLLINPSGITFGAGSQIDVAGLVASSLHLSDADFLAGRLRFSGTGKEGAVLNKGEILTPAGGSVMLVAPQVENSGVIRAPSGDIVLAAGSTVRLVDTAFPSIQIEVSAPKDKPLNLGTLEASGKVFAYLVKQSGVVSASAAQSEPGGRVVLRSAGDVQLAAASRIEASGSSGGSISIQAQDLAVLAGAIEARGAATSGGEARMTGERVLVAMTARVDVSGASGGGKALIGGGWQGKDPSVENARATLVEAGASIKANATQGGDGGTVVVFAEDSTRMGGAIEARGGPLAGDGGKVEVSGRGTLSFYGAVDTRAPAGKDGELLLDPARIEIVAGTTGIPSNLAGGTWLAADNPGSQRLGAVDLANLLNTTSVRLQATQEIVVAAAAQVNASPTGPRTLILQAPSIDVQGAVRSSTAALDLRLEAPGGKVAIASGADVSLAGGTLAIAAQSANVEPAQNTRVQVELARAAALPASISQLRAEVEAEIARDRDRLATSLKPCSGSGSVKAGCSVTAPPRRFVLGA